VSTYFRKKSLENKRTFTNTYFWGTAYQLKIDYIEEEREGKFYAFEFKWNPKKITKRPKKFLEGYPNTKLKVVNKDNFQEFLLEF